MASPLTTSRNKYHENEKNSSIYTPPILCNFLRDLIAPVIVESPNNVKPWIFDTSVGTGNLLEPFSDIGFEVWGVEWDLTYKMMADSQRFIQANFLDWDFSLFPVKIRNTGLVIQNPPFNVKYCLRKIDDKEIDYKLCDFCEYSVKCMKYYLKSIRKSNYLLSELFLDQTWKIFGKEIPCVCVVPMGFRLNQRLCSSRFRHVRDNYPDITSIISLPLDIFPGVEFQCEILIFNLPMLKPHYYLTEEYLK